jgi:hypothetical protein
MDFPLDPHDVHWFEQASVKVANRAMTEPAVDEGRRLDDDVVVGNQVLAAEVGESSDARRVIFVLDAE